MCGFLRKKYRLDLYDNPGMGLNPAMNNDCCCLCSNLSRVYPEIFPRDRALSTPKNRVRSLCASKTRSDQKECCQYVQLPAVNR